MAVLADTQALLSSITDLAFNASKDDFAARDKLLCQIDRLRLSMETPLETAFRIGYQPWQHSAIRLAIDMDIFVILTESKLSKIDVETLASKTKSDGVLIIRLLRMLVALGLCSGNPLTGYSANEKTAIFTVPEGRDSFKIWSDLGMPTAMEFPKYFQSHGYANPEHSADSPFASAFGAEFWTWKSQNTCHSVVFDSFMSSRRKDRPCWFELYPVKERILDPNKGGPCTIVDVGGGRGHDLVKFREAYPDSKDKLILQDLPEVLSGITETLEDVAKVPYNFFEPQPIRGAKIYVFRAIFHDWPTESCRIILQQTAEAMTPGYSKLLISDFVLDDSDPHVFSSSIDLQMMGLHAGMERSEGQWKQLLESVGLHITAIFEPAKASEAVIEAELSTDTCENPSEAQTA